MQGRWFSDYNYLCYREDNHWFYSDRRPDDVVCTRAEFEAYVKEQEGEKWTHTYSDYGVRKDCILVQDKPDIHGQVLALNRYDEYVLTGTVELKPIKPAISKADAWDRIRLTEDSINSLDDAIQAITTKYDII